MTFSAVATSEKVAGMISSSDAGCIMHGPTFMGNPLACAVALASTRLLLASNWQTRVREIEAILNEELAPARSLPFVKEVRVLGGIGVIELHDYISWLGEFQKKCVEEGVWIRPFAHNAYLMPPFLAVTDDQVRFLARKLIKILKEILNQ